MTENDELRALWNCSPPATGKRGEDIMQAVQQRTQRLDRAIRNRNWRECIAAGLVFAFFLWGALRTADAFVRAGSLIIMASAIWIAFYFIRFGKARAAVAPDQSLTSYAQSLAANYDHQIRLLKSVKYWYLLPPYLGLLTLTAGQLLARAKAGGLNWGDAVYPAIYTVFFAAVWWLNEVYTVGKLRESRAKILAMTKQNDLTQEEGK
jgi:hypothetical protein